MFGRVRKSGWVDEGGRQSKFPSLALLGGGVKTKRKRKGKMVKEPGGEECLNERERRKTEICGERPRAPFSKRSV